MDSFAMLVVVLFAFCGCVQAGSDEKKCQQCCETNVTDLAIPKELGLPADLKCGIETTCTGNVTLEKCPNPTDKCIMGGELRLGTDKENSYVRVWMCSNPDLTKDKVRCNKPKDEPVKFKVGTKVTKFVVKDVLVCSAGSLLPSFLLLPAMVLVARVLHL